MYSLFFLKLGTHKLNTFRLLRDSPCVFLYSASKLLYDLIIIIQALTKFLILFAELLVLLGKFLIFLYKLTAGVHQQVVVFLKSRVNLVKLTLQAKQNLVLLLELTNSSFEQRHLLALGQ